MKKKGTHLSIKQIETVLVFKLPAQEKKMKNT